MLEQLKVGLEQWKATTNDRQKQQHTYVAVSVAALVIAGIISLIDNELGQNIAYLALASIVVFIINGIVWHLLVDNLLERIKDSSVKKK